MRGVANTTLQDAFFYAWGGPESYFRAKPLNPYLKSMD